MVRHEEEYVVEKILDLKRHKQRNGRFKMLYLVKWEGYDDLTWEPFEHLLNCKDKLDDFLLNQRASNKNKTRKRQKKRGEEVKEDEIEEEKDEEEDQAS